MLERIWARRNPGLMMWAMAVVSLIVGVAVSLSRRVGIALGILVLFSLGFPFLLENPHYALYAFALVLPFGESDLVGGDTPVAFTLSNVLVLLLTGLLIGHFFRRGGRVRLREPYKPYVVAVSLIVITDLASVAFHPEGMRFLSTRVSFILTFLAGVVFIDSPRKLRTMLRCLAISLIIVSILTLLTALGYTSFGQATTEPAQRIGEWRPFFQRAVGIPGVGWGLYGMFMLSTFPLMLVSLFERGPLFRCRVFSAIWLAIVALGLFVSQLRSAWLSLIAASSLAILLLWSSERGATRNSTRYLAVLRRVGLILLVILSIVWFWQDLLGLGSAIMGIRPRSLTQRVNQMEFAWETLLESPQSLLFGVGYLRFGDLYSSVFPNAPGFFLDNHFMGQLFGSGVLGLLPYGFLLLVALREFFVLVRSGKGQGRLWGIGLLAGFVGMLVVLVFWTRLSNLKLLWLMIALSQRVGQFSASWAKH